MFRSFVQVGDGNESTDTEDEFAALDEHAQAEVRALLVGLRAKCKTCTIS